MVFFSVFLASFFVSASSLCMRRGLDLGGTTKTYLVIQMATAFLVAFLVGPVKTGSYSFNAPIATLGLCSGVILALMFSFLGKSLEYGPPGLTFSILSSATVMPAIVLALVFGASFGFAYTAWHGVGSLLVLVGIFWAGKGIQGLRDKRAWILFAGAMFVMHVVLLVVFQFRAILLGVAHPEELSSFFTFEQIRSQWFTPMIYVGATLVQLAIFLKTQRRRPSAKEWLYGCAGGACNSLCTFFLIKGTELASKLENVVIFPLFSVGSIIFTNLWGQRLYQETVNWRACQLCACGILIGTLDWKAIAIAFGF